MVSVSVRGGLALLPAPSEHALRIFPQSRVVLRGAEEVVALVAA